MSRFAALVPHFPSFRPGASSPVSSPVCPAVPPAPPRRRAAGDGRLLRRSLAASTGEGALAEVLNACAGGAVLTGWALHLGGGPLAVGVLGALPFLAQLLHLPAAWLTSALGRRKVALLAVAASRQAWLPLVFLPFLPLPASARLGVLIAVAAVSSMLGVVGNNAWVAWMGDLVPGTLRGRYFARRTAVCTVAGTLANLAAGLVVDHARAAGNEDLALSCLALLACLSGAGTTLLMARQHEPGGEERSKDPSRLKAALAPLSDPGARALLAYQIAWSAALGISGSFFAVHMLQNLRMGFALMALQGAGVAVVRVLAVPAWGRAVDRLGAKPVLVTCSFGIATIPLIWLLPTPDNLWPVLIDAVASGILWSGHSLAAFALPLAVAPREGRPFYLAAFSAASGVAFAVASAVGGAVAERLPVEALVLGHSMFGLQTLFVVSALARLGAGLLALRILEPGAQPAGALVRSAARRALDLHPRTRQARPPPLRRDP
ncbi:MAG: MFS transporter [Deltaproteobacteria bacterium]|nr:MFS transporter [Deltaproteobacteria bacterium]